MTNSERGVINLINMMRCNSSSLLTLHSDSVENHSDVPSLFRVHIRLQRRYPHHNTPEGSVYFSDLISLAANAPFRRLPWR